MSLETIPQVRQSNHWVNMTDLEPSTTYYYRVGDKTTATWSKTYHFKSAPNAETLSTYLPQRFLVWGDLGSSDSPPKGSATIMPYASQEILAGGIDMILHVGDFAYDFDTAGGKVGRDFMNDIQNMSAFVPCESLP